MRRRHSLSEILVSDMLVVLWLLLLFVVFPLILGWEIPRLATATAVWIAFGSLMAVIQSQDDELGGVWPIVVFLVLFGTALVYAGHRGRRRRAGSS